MSLFDDDASEMSRHRLINDRDAEAILTGSSPAADFDELTHFLGRVKHVAHAGAPMPLALTMLLSELSNENGDLSATTASNVNGPALQVAELPKRRSRMPIQFAAGLSLAAKIALGAGLAAAGATGAAAAGVLPGPVQHAAASIVRTVTPFEVPDDASTPTPSTTFGARVSSDANGTSDGRPGVDGATISSEAKAKAEAKHDEHCTAVHASTKHATNGDATNGDATNGDATNGDSGAPAGHAGCKPHDSASAAADPQDGHGKPAAPGQNGLDTAASTPAADHVPTSTPGGASNGGTHSSPGHGTHPSSGANPATGATPAVPPTDDDPAASGAPDSPAVGDGTRPSGSGHDGETPPSHAGTPHH